MLQFLGGATCTYGSLFIFINFVLGDQKIVPTQVDEFSKQMPKINVQN